MLVFFTGCSLTKNLNEQTEFKDLTKQNEVTKNKNVKNKFFELIQIAKFSLAELPCINATIEENQFLLKLDLGFRGDLCIEKEKTASLSGKSFIGEKYMFGVRGNKYQHDVYQIPKLKIKNATFSPIRLIEEHSDFVKEVSFIRDKNEIIKREEDGKIGWELFCTCKLLLNFEKDQIAVCNSIDLLNENGYPIETYTKTPLLLERGLVEFETLTSNGPLRCVLDTGCTGNILHTDLDPDKSIDVAIWEEDNRLEHPSFKIGEAEFGPVSFHRMPIKLPIHVDAILGMEFLKNHVVFLDFEEKTVYFSK